MAEIDKTLARRKSEVASRRGALSALKQQELEKLLNQTVSEQAPVRVILRCPDGEAAPLSFAQERLWFLNQLERESIAYNVCIPLRITGQLNVAALSQSINEAVRRHESLRTTFISRDGKPIQIIAEPTITGLPIVDLGMLPELQRSAVVERLLHEGYRRKFNLAAGPLFQPALFRVTDEEHILLVLLHHIVFDQWSMQILTREVGEIYQSFDLGQTSSLPELPVQYADFAHWHRDLMRDDVLAQELSYWRKQLEDSPELLNLPTDRPRPPVMAAVESRIAPPAIAIARVTVSGSFNAMARGLMTLPTSSTAR